MKQSQILKIFGKRSLPPRASGGRAGRPQLIDATSAAQLHKLIRRLQTEEGPESEITAERIYRRWKGKKKCSFKTLKRWVSSRYRWKAPSPGAKLYPKDIQERKKFKATHGGKGAAFWRNMVFIDGHTVKKFCLYRVRKMAASGRVRGQYRRIDGKKTTKVSKLPPCHKRNRAWRPGGKNSSVKYVFGVSHARGIFFMYRIDNEGGWNAKRAVDMYRRLSKAIGPRRQPGGVTVFEDNDPVWKDPRAAEEKAKMGLLELAGGVPRRSPDLNPLDFAINAEIDKRVARSYRRSAPKRLSHALFGVAVSKIAFSSSMTKFVRKCIDSMPARVAKLDPEVVT